MGPNADRPASRVLSGTALQIAGRALSALVTVLILSGISRLLEPAAFGKVLFYLSFFNLIAALSDCGFSPCALAIAAREPARTGEVVALARRGRWLAALPGLLVIPLLAAAYGDPPGILAVLGAAALLLAPLGLSGIAYQREVRYLPLFLARSAGIALTAVLVLALVVLGTQEWPWYLAAFLLGDALTNLALFAAVQLERPARAESGAFRALFGAAWPLGLAAGAQQLYFQSGNFFVRSFHGEESLAVYAAPFRLFVLSLMVPQYATGAAMPVFAATAGGDAEERRTLRRKVLRGLLLLGLPAAGAALLFAEGLLGFVFGTGYEEGGPALRWLAAAGLAVVFGAVGTTALLAAGRTKALMMIQASAVALAVPAQLLLADGWGPTGAAAANALIEAYVAAASWTLLLRPERKGA